MYAQNNYNEFRCPKCRSFDRDYVDWNNFKCKICGFVEEKEYEYIPHSDSFCPIVQSSGDDKILSYKVDDENE